MAVLPPDSLFSLRSNAMHNVNSLSFLNTDKLLAGTLEGVIHLWDLDVSFFFIIDYYYYFLLKLILYIL